MAVPIEPPVELLPARRAARRGKLLAVPGGALVFLAMFLPVLKVCDDPVYPIQFPPVYGPYLLGLAGAIAVMKVDRAAIKVSSLFVVMMSLASMTLFGLMVWAEAFDSPSRVAPMLVIAWSVAAVGLLTTFRRGATWSSRGARALTVGAVADVVFFGLLCSDRNAMGGAYVGLFGAVLLLLGALCWEVESAGSTDPPPVPPMRAL